MSTLRELRGWCRRKRTCKTNDVSIPVYPPVMPGPDAEQPLACVGPGSTVSLNGLPPMSTPTCTRGRGQLRKAPTTPQRVRAGGAMHTIEKNTDKVHACAGSAVRVVELALMARYAVHLRRVDAADRDR